MITSAVRILPAGIRTRGDRLYVQTTFTNVGTIPITVDRDGVVLRLADGRVLNRSSGITTRHTPYQLPPGAGRAVYVDFLAEGFDWAQVTRAQVDWTNAVFQGASPVPVPPLDLHLTSVR